MSSIKNSGATSNRLELDDVQGAFDDGFGLKEAIEETAKVYFLYCYTVWKFQDFCITEILREINFGDSRSAKTAVFAILRAVNLYIW